MMFSRRSAICELDDPRVKGVEKTVYCLKQPLQDLGPADNFNFRNDHARSMMVWRWMAFYMYVPRHITQFETHRKELRKRLGFSSPEYGQKLGWFLNKQFQAFKERGLISQPKDREPATYLKETDRWLSEDWDGEIWDQADKPEVATTPLPPEKTRWEYTSKRPASERLNKGEKRQKTPAEPVSESDANDTTISAGLESPTFAESVIELHMRSPTYPTKQQSTTVLPADERSSNHSDPRDSDRLVETAARVLPDQLQEASPQGGRTITPAAVLIVEEEAALDEASYGTDKGSDHDVVITLNSAQRTISSSADNGVSLARLLYQSPYSAQLESRSAVFASQEAQPILEWSSAVEQQGFETTPNSMAAAISPFVQPTDKVVSSQPRWALPGSDEQITYDEAALLKDCFITYLLRENINNGEYGQYDGLVSEYEYGWWDCYITNFGNSEIRNKAYVQAKQEISSPESPLRSRQDLEGFLLRWRSGRSRVVAAVMSSSMVVQSQSNPLIPDSQGRKQYEEWCQEVEAYRKCISLDHDNRRFLEDAISQMETSIREVEVLASLARTATEGQRQTILQLRDELRETKDQELQVLLAELQSLLKAIHEKDEVVESLEQKKRQYISSLKSRLGTLEAMVKYVRSLPEL